MKRKICVVLVLFMLFALCVGSLAQAAPQGGQADACKMYNSFVGQATGKAGCSIQDQIARKQLTGDIYEYSLTLKVGPGSYDKIGLHRVVKERAPWIPAPVRNAVMMIHGDTCNFDMGFATPNPSQESPAICLAQQSVDVWGIDLRWALVPDTATDFSFMKNWNTALYLKDIQTAVQVCRSVRFLTGDGFDKVILLGHSRGAQLSYSYANQQAVLPEGLQDVKGIIPVDLAYKLNLNDYPNDPVAQAIKQGAQTRYNTLKALYASGTYNNNDGAMMKGLSGLAAVVPNVYSQYNPVMTNIQFALAALTATYMSATPQMPAATPFFHYMAGTFDPSTQLPTGLQFADQNYVLNIGMATPSFQSIGEQIDGDAILSDKQTPYDNHLRQIKIPVFYIGAGGGFGQYGADTLKFLGSTDKETLIINTFPAMPILDYGHADLLWASNAEGLVWNPIAKWIADH